MDVINGDSIRSPVLSAPCELRFNTITSGGRHKERVMRKDRAQATVRWARERSNGESEVDVNRKQSRGKDRSATILIVSAAFESETTLLEAVLGDPQSRSTSLRWGDSEDNTPLQKLHD